MTVVVVTHGHARGLASVLRQLRQMPEQPRLIVLDNASRHAVAVAQIACLHDADLMRCEHHLGTAACNEVIARVTTPHVAFCDDGTWWSDGALKIASDLLDEYPHIGAINGRVLVGSNEAEHPCCERMQHSALDNAGLPGPALISFMPNAVVMRTRAFRHAGGYEPDMFCGTQEVLIGLSLAALGWRIVYARDVTMHQLAELPCRVPTTPTLEARNRLWVAWLRLPWPDAWQETRAVCSQAWHDHHFWSVLWQAIKPISWLFLHRRAVPDLVAQMHRTVRSPLDTAVLAKPSMGPHQRRATRRSTNMPPC